MKRIVILASGSGTLAQAIFDAQLDADIVAVISDQQNLHRHFHLKLQPRGC